MNYPQAFTFVFFLAVVAGCNDGKFKTYPVTGTVKFADGEPLPTGQIYLETKDKTYGAGISAMGQIGEDGRFELRTYEPGDGAPPGNYPRLHSRGYRGRPGVNAQRPTTTGHTFDTRQVQPG